MQASESKLNFVAFKIVYLKNNINQSALRREGDPYHR